MIAKLFCGAWDMLIAKASAAWLWLALPLVVLIYTDEWTLAKWSFSDGTPVHKVAEVISERGDFYNGSAVIVGGLFLIGVVRKSKRLKILAVAMLLSCAVAGVSSLLVRVGSGRPRPVSETADGLYGLVFKERKGRTILDYDFQAFPSGHTTTAVATAAPALVMAPAVGVPLTVAAVGVAWARFELHRHRVSDLYLGALWGASFGAIFGLAGLKQLKGDKKV